MCSTGQADLTAKLTDPGLKSFCATGLSIYLIWGVYPPPPGSAYITQVLTAGSKSMTTTQIKDIPLYN